MAVSLGMQLQLSQKLVMTPQLKQALTVLQLPALLLREYVTQELQANPALELVEDSETPEVSDGAGAPVAAPDADAEPIMGGEAGEGGDLQRGLADWIAALDDGWPLEARRVSERGAVGVGDLAAWDRPAPLTLQEHLRQQVGLSDWPARDKAGVLYLAGSLDGNGYLAEPLADLARDRGVGTGEAERLLSLLQQLDPPGVGARDLRECLLLQLRQRQERDPLVWRLVEDHLPDIAAGRWAALARPLGVTPAALDAARAKIRSLEPKPGRAFAGGPEPQHVVPDAYVERVGREYVIVLNDRAVPRVILSPAYRQALRAADDSARRYVEARLQEGLWLLRALEQRRLTLYRVVEVVVRRQQAYLERGAEALHPLTLRAVGEALSLHESTISRAVAGKFIQTPRGLHPLRYFFGSGVEGPGGEGISATSVKRRIQRLIGSEDPHRPLADDALCSMLQAEGVAISRRTVAKYRQELGVPASNRRR